jgi:hypothetical protein
MAFGQDGEEEREGKKMRGKKVIVYVDGIMVSKRC